MTVAFSVQLLTASAGKCAKEGPNHFIHIQGGVNIDVYFFGQCGFLTFTAKNK